MHYKGFNEREPDIGETQWMLEWAFLIEQDSRIGEQILLLAENAERCKKICGAMYNLSKGKGDLIKCWSVPTLTRI